MTTTTAIENIRGAASLSDANSSAHLIVSWQDDSHLSTGTQLEEPPHALQHLRWPTLWVPALLLTAALNFVEKMCF